ncbi:MAG: bifunctional UDP-N-acetylglucosamine diphosphorylase/glucosamine-1-phosphate N-acetyltransferase GlmU [Betaproteobacteria bacterium]|nr:bifunctional UDP-N-acetylglucosamine diphosphorylase/glucosamine-1-phosphate N-acetyltransferase GlmU [Betaproteobacteria bacterium]
MTALNVVILAAGKGIRMHSNLPKVLHPLAGRPLLAHVIETARALRPKTLSVVYGHGGEEVPKVMGGHGVIIWVKQEPQLGTGHALMQALPHLEPKGVTLVLYGDVPLVKRETLEKILAHGDKALTLLTVELDDPTGYGRIVRNAKGDVVRIVEQKDAKPAERKIREINTGIMAIPAARLAGWLKRLKTNNAQKEYYLTDIIALAVKDKVKVAAAQPEGPWEVLGVNSKAQLAQIERVYQAQWAYRLLDQGVTLADPARIDVRGSLACGRDVAIDVNCVFEGKVSLGDQVHVGAHCVLKNVSVNSGTVIHPFSHLEDAEIGCDCRIGPYARIRPGTRLDAEVHIGNFVEVKASQVGARSKANHLAYVGDTTVGKNVNIGAGTITCNYDGINKHRTIIEDDVFIGSDTQLVAPVTVRKGATIGAGSTITREAPPDALTLSRAKQVTVPGWKRPVKKPKGET